MDKETSAKQNPAEIKSAALSAGLVDFWGKGVFFFLSFSLLFLGFGRFDSPIAGTGFSAWSISRTTFFFWLTWKLLLWSRHRRDRLVFKRGWFPLPLFTFFAVVTVSLLPDFHEPADYRYFFFAAMHCVMVLDLFAANGRPKLLLLLLGLLPGLLVVRGLAYNPSLLNLSSVLDFGVKNRFAYPLTHPNPAGLLFSMSIPLALTIAACEKGSLGSMAIASLVLQFIGLILTYSRGAWLACALSLLGLGLMERAVRKAVLAFGLTALIIIFAVGPLRSRVMTLVNPTNDIAIEGRLRFMADALAVGLENPILGVGYGRDRLREGVNKDVPNARQIGFIPHSHNLYTELLAETGLVGLTAFLWMVLSNVMRLLRKARREFSPSDGIRYFGSAASLIAFLVFSLGDVPLYNHDTRIFFFTLLALTYLFLRRDLPAGSGAE